MPEKEENVFKHFNQLFWKKDSIDYVEIVEPKFLVQLKYGVVCISFERMPYIKRTLG